MNHSHDSASALRADSWEVATTSVSPAARLWSWSHTTCWYSTPASSNNRSSSSIAGDSSLEAVTTTRSEERRVGKECGSAGLGWKWKDVESANKDQRAG